MSGPPTGPVEAVTFDYWNTLCYEPDMDRRRDLVADAWVEVLSDAGIQVARDTLSAAFDAGRAEFWTAWHENRQFTGVDAARHTLTAIDGNGSLDHLVEPLATACAETAEVVPVTGVGGVLESLRNAGVRIGIICDVGITGSPYLRRHLEDHRLIGFFDHWSFSDEVGVYKPDPRIFEHALAGLGSVAPQRAAHVGDRRRTDVAGAQRFGMKAIRFTGVYDDTDPDEGPDGDAVIGSYAELLPALGV